MQTLYIHPDNPQPRLIKQAVRALNNDELIIYPNDTGYAFALSLNAKNALQTLKQLRGLNDKHQFTLLCRDLSEIAAYAVVDNQQYRTLKAHTPSAITFILTASKDVPKKLAHPKKKTIGIRVPSNAVARMLLDEMNAPLLTSSLVLPDCADALEDPYDIEERLGTQVAVFLNTGLGARHLSSIVDMTTQPASLVRQGLADVSMLID